MALQTNYGSRAMKDRVYTPRPLPTNTEDFNAYFADEFSYLGGFIDKMLSGQSIPYRSELPARVKDGMVIYFKDAIRDLQTTDVNKYIIPSPGLYVFKGVFDESKPVGGASEPVLKGGEWLRLIEDPESLRRNLTVYTSVLKTASAPAKPPQDKYKEGEISPWSYIIPAEQSDRQVYSSSAIDAVVGDAPSVTWSTPTPYNQAGRPGAGFFTHNSASINSWPVNASAILAQEAGRDPVNSDTLTIVNTSAGFYETRRYNGVSWVKQDVLFDGSIIAKGTITGDKIIAGAEIEAPKINAGELNGGTINGGHIIGETDLKIGSGGPFGGYNFHVDPSGNFYANNGTFNGTTNLEKGTGVIMGSVGARIELDAATADQVDMKEVGKGGSIESAPFDRTLMITTLYYDVSMDSSGEYSGTVYGNAYSSALNVLLKSTDGTESLTLGTRRMILTKNGVAPGFASGYGPNNGAATGVLPPSSPVGQFPWLPSLEISVSSSLFKLSANKDYRVHVERNFWMNRSNSANMRVVPRNVYFKAIWFKTNE